MLIKDDNLAKKRMGQQVIYGMAEQYELYLFPEIVESKEPVYIVCATIDDNDGKIGGIVKPWSKLLLDYQRRGQEASDLYTMFPKLLNEMELVTFKGKLYAVSRMNTNNFIIVGASVILFAAIENDELIFSGVNKTNELDELDIKMLINS